MSGICFEYTDDIATGDRIINIRLASSDMAAAKLTEFDYALFDDINNGELSNTPLADQLLGLETLVRRIEESTAPTEQKEEKL